MHVMHIGKYFAPFKGGVENMMLALMKAQINAGLNVSAFIHQHQIGMPFTREERFGARIYRTPIVGKLLFVPIALLAIIHLRKALKETQPDVIHAHLPNVTCFLLLALKQAKHSPLVVHWHSDVLGEKPNRGVKLLYPIYRIFEKSLLSRANKIIVTSENYLKISRPLKPFKQKCVVVPLGLEDKPPKSNKPNTTFNSTALCVGRLTYYKGHRFLVEAVAKLKNASLTLTIVGDGELLSPLQHQTSLLNIEKRICFLGQVSDSALYNLIESCDFLVLPSIERTEAFGLVLLEAMRAGKPCICTDVPGSGMSEVVLHNKTGLVVQHANANSLANAMEKLASDEELSTMLGLNGRERFLNHFTVSKVEALIHALYHNVVKSTQ